MITIYVSAIPPTVNHIYRAGRGGARYLSQAAISWYEYAIPEIRSYLQTTRQPTTVPPKTRLRVTVTVLGLPRTTDIDNIGKASIDALARALGFDDRWIDDLRLVRGAWKKGDDTGTAYTLEVLQ
jgi:Holliday junction resolvase RusA-like endonuclease